MRNLRVEYKTEPIGMDEPIPRFSWETSLKKQDWYRIIVTAGGSPVWDSGKVCSSMTAQVEYGGECLRPFTRYDWTVENGGDGEDVKASSFFETGFMGTAWTAPWVKPSNFELTSNVQPVHMAFSCTDVVSARLCITACGLFEAKLNGSMVADDVLPPGYTQYDKRIQYRVYNVDSLVRSGENVLDVELASGWFSGNISTLWNGCKATWGASPMMRAELRLVKADGTVEIIPLNSENAKFFFVNEKADIYDGVVVEGWYRSNMGSKDHWQKVIECDGPAGAPAIVWSCSEPVAHIMDVSPVSITPRGNGAYIVDFGQNLVGREQFTLRNNIPGTMICIRHGEMLRKDGSLYYDNLRTAAARTIYVSGENETETFEPRFTFYGFRYIDVTGWPGELRPEDIKARVIHTKLNVTGNFSSTDEMLNKLHSCILWGQRGNFVDVPTDCPQRDERLGWTADTQVFADEATWNMDAASFYTKWLADLNASQSVNGGYGNFSPSPYDFVHDYNYTGATGWADAGVVCPWVMMEKYGDVRIVKKYMPQMLRWLDWEIRHSGGSYILDAARFSDWLYIGWGEDPEKTNHTPNEYLSSAYLAGMLRLAARMLRLIGCDDEAALRERQYCEARKAMQNKFLDGDGKPIVRTQTALAMALTWDLFDGASAEKAAELLVNNIVEVNGCHLTTGFLGTPLLLDVLVKIGQVDLAYDLLFQDTYPGWMYPITQGATTMWERWNSYTHKDGFGNVGMNSFNHYAYGAVGAWFYRSICGIQPLSESVSDLGFARFRLAPIFGRRLGGATAEYVSIRGLIRSSWTRQEDGSVKWDITVPPNTTAEVVLPDRESFNAGPGEYSFTVAN